MSIPERRIPGVRELNIGDQWRAQYVDEDLPDDLPVTHAYVVVLKDERGYLTRPRGSDDHWSIVEVEVGDDEEVEEAVKAAARERTGGVVAWLLPAGYLECRATRHNPDYAEGSRAARVFYAAVASEVSDVPEGSGWERRRFRLNDLGVAIRRQHRELEAYLDNAVDRYLVARAKGEVR